MKRLITLALVLVMALSLAAPAMAFTGIASVTSDDQPELAIKLVDLSEGFVTVNFNAPPTNRGYVKNEVVCAVVSMQVPKDYEFESSDVLEFSGVNVSLWQDENFYAHTSATSTGGGIGTLRYTSNNVSPTTDSFSYAADMAADNYIRYNALTSLSDKAAQTYHFAIFGRVLGDNAKMNATLKGTGTLPNVYASTAGVAKGVLDADDEFNFTVIKDYSIGYFSPFASKTDSRVSGAATATVATYATASADQRASVINLGTDEILYLVILDKTIGTVPKGAAFAVVADENYKCERLYVNIEPGVASWSRVYDGNKKEDAIMADFWGGVYVQFQMEDYNGGSGAKAITLVTGTDAAQLMLFLREVVYGEFGLDIRGLGNVLKPDWWFGNESQTVEVAIEPWYAEVTVPPEIEIEIPKTGDAMSVVGFVLIALAGLAIVAVRKVKA